MKSFRILNFPGPYLPAFGLNTERYAFSPNAGKYGPEKFRIQTLHAVIRSDFFYQNMNCLVILTQSQPLITGEAFQDWVLLDYAHIQDRVLLDYAHILRCRVTKVNVLDQKEL